MQNQILNACVRKHPFQKVCKAELLELLPKAFLAKEIIVKDFQNLRENCFPSDCFHLKILQFLKKVQKNYFQEIYFGIFKSIVVSTMNRACKLYGILPCWQEFSFAK